MMLSAILLIISVSAVQGSNVWDRYVKFFNETLPNDSNLMRLWEEHLQNWHEQNRVSKRYSIPEFNCHRHYPHSGLPPASVHHLHPSDIKVVAAMGDSLTAGNGILASNVIGDFIEYRGHSWSIGGDEDLTKVLTFPNILKVYSPSLTGYSVGIGGINSFASNLNVAEPGNVASDMPRQANELVKRLKENVNVDFNNDWKVITLFIGGNDLCDFCNNRAQYSPGNYVAYIRTALDILHQNVPKAFVNLVQIFDIAALADVGKNNFFCGLVQGFICTCGVDSSVRDELQSLAAAYQFELDLLVKSHRYETRDDFTVVLQPFFENTRPPSMATTGAGSSSSVDMSFFSPDCFHFSEKGHFAAGLSLWNNMLESPSHKQKSWHLFGDYECPSTHFGHTHPYFTTYLNSQ